MITNDNNAEIPFTARDYWIIALHLFLALGAPTLGWLGIILLVRWVTG